MSGVFASTEEEDGRRRRSTLLSYRSRRNPALSSVSDLMRSVSDDRLTHLYFVFVTAPTRPQMV